MNSRTVYLVLLGVAATPVHAQDFIWAGSAQCELTVTATRYQDVQMQVWQTTIGPPTTSDAITLYPATWSTEGSGTLERPQGPQTLYAYWMRRVDKMSAPISVTTRPLDGAVLIGAGHTYKRVGDGVTGTQELRAASGPWSKSKFALEAFEYPFPAIVVEPNRTRVIGEKTETVAGNFGAMQPADAKTLVRCTWDFRKVTRPPGSGPIPAPPPPDCKAMVAAVQTRYQQMGETLRTRHAQMMQDYDRRRAEAVARQDAQMVERLDAERGAIERAHAEDLERVIQNAETETAKTRARCSG